MKRTRVKTVNIKLISYLFLIQEYNMIQYNANSDLKK